MCVCVWDVTKWEFYYKLFVYMYTLMQQSRGKGGVGVEEGERVEVVCAPQL